MGLEQYSDFDEKAAMAVRGFRGIDRTDARILMFTYESPRRLPTICTILGIPLAECHARIKRLIMINLLKSYRLTLNSGNPGKRRTLYDFYYANTRKVRIIVKGNRHKVQVSLTGPSERILVTPQERQ
ncbi:MAG: hypothetical protein ACE5IO_06780 [Thermoplasmata archaeon]